MDEDKTLEETDYMHKAARPLKWVKDKNGDTWLCDKEVNPDGDMRQQGCWRCDEMAFPTGGR